VRSDLETKAKFRESDRLPKAPGFKPSPCRWLAVTSNPDRTGESAKCLIFNGPISMPVAFAYRKGPKNALRSFRHRNREGSNRVAFAPPVASFGNFSIAWAADRNRRVSAVFGPWLLTFGGAGKANFARVPSLHAPILHKLLTAPKRYPFRDRLESMAYRSKAVDLFET